MNLQSHIEAAPDEERLRGKIKEALGHIQEASKLLPRKREKITIQRLTDLQIKLRRKYL